MAHHASIGSDGTLWLAYSNDYGPYNVIAQPPVSWNTNASTYNVNGAQYWFSSGAQVGTNATNWVEAVALDPFSSRHAMYGTGAGVWSSTNIQSATGSSGQGVTWTFTDSGLEETVPLFVMPAVKGAFLSAIGDLGGMRNTNLDAAGYRATTSAATRTSSGASI